MLKVKTFFFNDFSEATYVVYDPASRQAAVVDPGMNDVASQNAFDSFIAAEGLTVTQIINTHLHLDHIFGDNYVHRRCGAPIAAHEGDAGLGRTLREQCAMFTPLPDQLAADLSPVTIDVVLTEGDTVSIGANELTVLSVPGHSPGSIALYDATDGFVLVGDLIFCGGGIGRADLPGGNPSTLMRSVSRLLSTLPPGTVIYPGHGRPTTVAQERRFHL